jgi:hypothetical protein
MYPPQDYRFLQKKTAPKGGYSYKNRKQHRTARSITPAAITSKKNLLCHKYFYNCHKLTPYIRGAWKRQAPRDMLYGMGINKGRLILWIAR